MSGALQRLGSFTAVGTVAFVVDISAFNILASGVGVGPITAKVISVVLATAVSWLGSHYVTFREFAGRPKRQEALLFGLTNLAGLGIAAACLAVSHYVCGLTSPLADNISANVVGVLLGNVFRYIAYRFFVFRPAAQAPAPVGTAGTSLHHRP
ncbi:GtrA family protein [Arthrobacter sp. NamB2]|uniref:GtrA family protein n=1 Tax=Arthrobacter sp. NamB2 TaxID=2576035 RepID=UPI0010C95068|nr:GtrA family protein [Arthrobacter sp. NamB2]TKV28781.1 GtrA family protein [Arthrobacter sp. NamB2]